MKNFNLYNHSSLGFKAIKVGFCWPALALGVLWMLAKKMWIESGIFIGVYLTSIIFSFLSIVTAESILLIFVPIIINLLLLFAPAVKGNSWQEKYLLKNEYQLVSAVRAKNEKDAIEQYNKSLQNNWYG
jgi:hypothetical protein